MFCNHTVDANTFAQDLRDHAAYRNARKAESVGVLAEGVFRPLAVEERLEVLDEVHPPARNRTAGTEHVRRLPGCRDEHICGTESLANIFDVGVEPRPRLTNDASMTLDPAAVTIVERQGALVSGVDEPLDDAEHRRVAAGPRRRRRGQPGGSNRLAAFGSTRRRLPTDRRGVGDLAGLQAQEQGRCP